MQQPNLLFFFLILFCYFYLARLQSLDPGLTHLLHKQKTVYLVLDDIDV